MVRAVTLDGEPTPLALAQAAAKASLAASDAATRIASLAMSQHTDVVARLDELKVELGGQRIAQVEIRADLRRIETLATTTAAQAERTNGSVGTLKLWQAEMKGIAQGTGGTGRLIVYVLGAGASAGAIMATAVKILDRVGG